MIRRFGLALACVATLVACRKPHAGHARHERAGEAPPPVVTTAPATVAPLSPGACGTMTVRFYDVGQGLAALVELPDGKRVLVDTGDNPSRSEQQCHGACARWHAGLMDKLARDLGGNPIDMLWITHQHSDHIGGAIDVLDRFSVRAYVDNGQELAKHEVRRVHEVAAQKGVTIAVVEPGRTTLPLASSARVSAVVPPAWPSDCRREPNDCSIGLRIDQCQSSVLFVGDAERAEEARFDTLGPATLLQVGHHGSETSTSPEFLARVAPRYAVISAAHRDDGTNESYCHPRANVVSRLTAALGGAPNPTGPVAAFDAPHGCGKPGSEAHWKEVPTSERLFVTARDGDVVLTSRGDGSFERR